MLNEIERVRSEIRAALNLTTPQPEEDDTELSPCGRYELARMSYGSVEVAEVRELATGEVAVTVLRDTSHLFHNWVTRDDGDYLLLPEEFEGQGVIDLSRRSVAGFWSKEETFIWCRSVPSPDGTRLAIEGCYWACQYQVTVYDFRTPLALPLPILLQIDLLVIEGTYESLGDWIDGARFTTHAKGAVRVHTTPGGRADGQQVAE